MLHCLCTHFFVISCCTFSIGSNSITVTMVTYHLWLHSQTSSNLMHVLPVFSLLIFYTLSSVIMFLLPCYNKVIYQTAYLFLSITVYSGTRWRTPEAIILWHPKPMWHTLTPKASRTSLSCKVCKSESSLCLDLPLNIYWTFSQCCKYGHPK